MMQISEIAELNSGTPQFRIKESLDADAPVYYFYSQSEIEDDLTGIKTNRGYRKHIRTFDNVDTVERGDVVFSLISGKAAIVGDEHNGYLITQNYVKLTFAPMADAGYLVYMLNENIDIKSQLQSGQQGSATLKFTIRQLNYLVFPILPPSEKQRIIGELYFNQLKLQALKKRVAVTETILIIKKLKEANES